MFEDRFFYILHFQEPGEVEAEFSADLPRALKTVYHGASADGAGLVTMRDLPRGAPMIENMAPPPEGPLSFMSDEDLDAYVRAFERSGLHGGFNRYRALAFEPEDTADIEGATVDRPSCFVAGALDGVRWMSPGGDAYADAGSGCTDFRGTTLVEGAGHWVQQEAPAATNAAIEAFLDTL